MLLGVYQNYQEFLIESLTDPQEAADYIEVVLEEGEDETQLLQTVLRNVIEAYEKKNQLSDSARKHYEKLDNILNNNCGREIYTFLSLLSELGFRVEIELLKFGASRAIKSPIASKSVSAWDVQFICAIF